MSTAKKIGLAAVSVIVVFGAIIALGVVTFLGKWGSTAVDIVSPENVKTQHYQVIQTFNSIQTAADNACRAGKVAKEDGDPLLVESPSVAYAALYARQVDDYNRRTANMFEAGFVAPPGYPNAIPALPEVAAGDWCAVSTQIRALKR